METAPQSCRFLFLVVVERVSDPWKQCCFLQSHWWWIYCYLGTHNLLAPLCWPHRSCCYFARSPKDFCGFFFEFTWNFASKNGGDFWWIFSGLRFPRNEARKLLNKNREKFWVKLGQNSGQKFEKFRELSFGNIFWPKLLLFPFWIGLPTLGGGHLRWHVPSRAWLNSASMVSIFPWGWIPYVSFWRFGLYPFPLPATRKWAPPAPFPLLISPPFPLFSSVVLPSFPFAFPFFIGLRPRFFFVLPLAHFLIPSLSTHNLGHNNFLNPRPIPGQSRQNISV